MKAGGRTSIYVGEVHEVWRWVTKLIAHVENHSIKFEMCVTLFLKNTGIKIRFKQNTVYFKNTFVTELTVFSDPTVKQKALA